MDTDTKELWIIFIAIAVFAIIAVLVVHVGPR